MQHLVLLLLIGFSCSSSLTLFLPFTIPSYSPYPLICFIRASFLRLILSVLSHYLSFQILVFKSQSLSFVLLHQLFILTPSPLPPSLLASPFLPPRPGAVFVVLSRSITSTTTNPGDVAVTVMAGRRVLATCATSERHCVKERPFTHLYLVTRAQGKVTEPGNKLGTLLWSCVLRKS